LLGSASRRTPTRASGTPSFHSGAGARRRTPPLIDSGATRLVRARSWADLNARLFHGTWNRSLGRHRGSFAYRGTAWFEGSLETSLARRGVADREPHLLRNFRKFAGPAPVPRDSPWDWLALAQHHGLPTRLLDWSFSPYVALHFATRDPIVQEGDGPPRQERDGVVWCIDYVAAHRRLPPVLRAELRRESADVFTTEMLGAVARGPRELDALAAEPFLLFLDPPSLDARMVNQFALFSMMAPSGATLAGWLRENPGVSRGVVIPASLKWEVRDRLDQINVTERVLFPGLDGLSRWLTRYYSPRGTEGRESPSATRAADRNARRRRKEGARPARDARRPTNRRGRGR